MPDYIVRYRKFDKAKYISHLDFLRTFNRVLRRSKIGIAYSKGFNPHPILSFALPLSVGVTSDTELLEMTLEKEIPCREIVDILNREMPVGIEVVEAAPSQGKIAKQIGGAVYEVLPDQLPTEKDLEDFLRLPEIRMEKKTKSGIKECDIKPDIHKITLSEGKIHMTLSAGSVTNLKPDLVMRALSEYTAFSFSDAAYHRTTILNQKGERM